MGRFCEVKENPHDIIPGRCLAQCVVQMDGGREQSSSSHEDFMLMNNGK